MSEQKVAKPWGSPHEYHSGLEADWCGNCKEEQKEQKRAQDEAHARRQAELRWQEEDRL